VELIRKRLARQAVRAEADRAKCHLNVVSASSRRRVEKTAPSAAIGSESRHQSRVRPGHAPRATKPLSALLTVWAQSRHGPIVSGEQQLKKLPHVAHRKRQALAVDWIVVSPGIAEKNDPVRIGFVAPRLLAAKRCARPCRCHIAQPQRVRD
jgi:hypothetical protein